MKILLMEIDSRKVLKEIDEFIILEPKSCVIIDGKNYDYQGSTYNADKNILYAFVWLNPNHQ